MAQRTRERAGSGARYDAGPYVPDTGDLAELGRAAASCRGCPLHAAATQTVFGSGPARAPLVLVGEQPGDREDREGEPFVGPAGTLLRRALAEAGLDASSAYFTNAVKHFKFTVPETGKRRIHKAPDLREMAACRPWLVAELAAVRPRLVVALGATAGRVLLGGPFRVGDHRGLLEPLPAEEASAGGPALPEARVLVTVHPSAVLRARDRDAAYRGLVADLEVAARALAQ
ncbi:DNA polymerase [Streptomyces sp. 3211.6]|uniref:UdgX family uracil-DNA binding protein n=1 Tax=Streptomyces TaxID=1883 RepID=UPI0009A5170A|nr:MULTISPECIES: UdgX family uracil-DNA binding protein [Streptomyces]RKT08483.1 DNA polymerase [Streptomyces sp. 3211.6]RPF29882.1 DNA polymerase [Streptomyces sp. Ag109_G2-6]